MATNEGRMPTNIRKAVLFVAACFLFVLISGLLLPQARGQEFTSTDYKVLDPVVAPGGYSTSDDYRLRGSITQISIARSTSGSFAVESGFLYYPEPSTAAAEIVAVAGGGNAGGGGPILEIFKKLFRKMVKPCSAGDLNCDGYVNLKDGSILFYWWNKPIKTNFAAVLANFIRLGKSSPDLNKDDKIDILDLSILLSRWTG